MLQGPRTLKIIVVKWGVDAGKGCEETSRLPPDPASLVFSHSQWPCVTGIHSVTPEKLP